MMAAAPWHCIRLSREDYDAGECFIIQAVFQESWIARNGLRGAALYGAWEQNRTAFTLYFSPQTAACANALLKAYSAEACGAPQLGRLELICGDAAQSEIAGVEF